jgi:cell division protein FtsB
MKWLAAALFVVVLLLQHRLWLSADGVREVTRLEAAVAKQEGRNEELAERNKQLAAEVRARSDLGMIARNETFYQVVPARKDASDVPASPGDARTRTAAVPPR